MIRAADHDSSTDRRRRLPCVLASLAIVVGLLAGALTCASVTGSIEARLSEDRPEAADMADVDAVAAAATHSHPAESTGDHATPAHHHANMACLVDITLQVADLDVVVVAEPNDDPDGCAMSSHALGPEPPVPRMHS